MTRHASEHEAEKSLAPDFLNSDVAKDADKPKCSSCFMEQRD